MTRSEAKCAFLEESGWASAKRISLKADASARSYERLIGSETAILMDSDPNRGESTEKFVRVAEHLCRLGLSVPTIYHVDHARGFLILEDFGDRIISNLLSAEPAQNAALSHVILDMLRHLQSHPLPDWCVSTSNETLAQMVAPAFEYFVKDEDQGHTIFETLLRVLNTCVSSDVCLSLRDCHAENMIFLPDREDIKSIGILDFQDAFACHPAYDVMSFLQDVRRPFDARSEIRMLTYFIEGSQHEKEAFSATYAALGFQRNFRILGRFAELAHRHNKTTYLAFMPTVIEIVRHNLEHPELAELKPLITPVLEGIA